MADVALDLIAEMQRGKTETPRVLVAGDLNYDIIDLLPQLPEQDKEIFVSHRSRTLAGSAGIFAHALGKLGAAAYFVGKVGDDEGGHSLCQQLEHVGVDTSSVERVQGGATAETHIYVNENAPGQRFMLTLRGVFDHLDLRNLDLAAYQERVNVVHFCSYFVLPKLQRQIPSLIQEARALGMKVSFDANSGDGWGESKTLDTFRREIFPNVDYLFLNRNEAASVTAQTDPTNMLEVLEGYNPKGILTIKLDAEGSQSRFGGRTVRVDAFPCAHIQDTVGAGDTFDATFVHFHQKGFSLADASILANANARATLERAGGPTGQRTEAGLIELLGRFQITCSVWRDGLEHYRVVERREI